MRYRNTGRPGPWVEISASVAATRSLPIGCDYTYTDARQRTPLVPGVWRTYEFRRISTLSRDATILIAAHRVLRVCWFDGLSYSISHALFASAGWRWTGRSQLPRPLSEFRAVRFYVKANTRSTAYFDNATERPARRLRRKTVRVLTMKIEARISVRTFAYRIGGRRGPPRRIVRCHRI